MFPHHRPRCNGGKKKPIGRSRSNSPTQGDHTRHPCATAMRAIACICTIALSLSPSPQQVHNEAYMARDAARRGRQRAEKQRRGRRRRPGSSTEFSRGAASYRVENYGAAATRARARPGGVCILMDRYYNFVSDVAAPRKQSRRARPMDFGKKRGSCVMENECRGCFVRCELCSDDHSSTWECMDFNISIN